MENNTCLPFPCLRKRALKLPTKTRPQVETSRTYGQSPPPHTHRHRPRLQAYMMKKKHTPPPPPKPSDLATSRDGCTDAFLQVFKQRAVDARTAREERKQENRIRRRKEVRTYRLKNIVKPTDRQNCFFILSSVVSSILFCLWMRGVITAQLL